MSHRNTLSKMKVSQAKREKKPGKLEKASGSTRGGTKQETVLGLLKQPKGTTMQRAGSNTRCAVSLPASCAGSSA
jgi:hypothetical protein